MPALRVLASAKINLFLEITGKRVDGYHTLSTLFQTISLADELSFRSAKALQLSCSNRTLPTDDRNLVMRAALRLQTQLREKQGAAIYLKKTVPMGAGLGGGSGDAGAVLATLPRLWKHRAGPAVLHRVARTLGADVPFFLKGGTCAAGGIGDQLRPLPALPKTWLVLVYPGFGVATKEAYARVRVPLTAQRSIHRMISLLKRPHPSDWVGQMFNRFEEFIFPTYPKLARLKEDLIRAGALGALMSGSGSTVFGVAASQEQGRRILSRMRKTYKTSWLVHTL
jgi:4-diphosphocytidyl-2-C-methyl-D-erythritol kinase